MESQEAVNGLKPLIDRIRKETFIDGSKATDADCLGILLAKYFQWDGFEILKTASAGLEDANFHSENAIIQAMISKSEKTEKCGQCGGANEFLDDGTSICTECNYEE